MKLYLDTSVFSAYYDERTPERMKMTRDFWPSLEQHEKLCSQLVIEELGQAHPNLKEKLLALTQNFTILHITDRMRDLAENYVGEGVVPSRYFADAIHIASRGRTWQCGHLS
jgi:predicted nucleic acid-binding protein